MNVTLQTHHTLALRAKNLQEAENQMSKLQAAAWKAKRMAGGTPDAIAEFWLLNSDLFDINRAEINVDARQRHAIDRLEKFVDEQTSLGFAQPQLADETHWSVVDSVKLSLLRLYDQRGMSDKARQLVDRIKSGLHRDDTTRRAYLDRLYGYCETIGHRFDAQVVTDSGQVWTSKAHEGMYVLIHFWAHWAQPSVDAFDKLQADYPEFVNKNVTVLSVQLDGSGAAEKNNSGVTWAMCSESTDTQRLRDLFGVNSLPRFVLIDTHGRVAAVGAEAWVCLKKLRAGHPPCRLRASNGDQ